jgi:hypothetical protein
MRAECTFSFPYRQFPTRIDTPQCKAASLAHSQPSAFGSDTFKAEVGKEGTKYFSRVIHWPTGRASGVTLGPGYDMGQRSAKSIVRDLTRAGVAPRDALFFSHSAGLQGAAAQAFVARHRDRSPTISIEAQQRIFSEVIRPAIIADIQRILAKPDTIRAYGALSWNALPPAARELLFDLRYRGDYTPATRRLLHPALLSGDFQRVAQIMQDRAMWRGFGVPEGRIDTRIRIARRIMAPSSPD